MYFERRANQFRDQEIKKVRIFDIKDLARANGSIFFDRPELASIYPNQLTSDMGDIVFSRNNDEEIFYTAAFALNRLKLNMGNKKIRPKYSKYACFMLMGCKYAIAGNKFNEMNKKATKIMCGKIYNSWKKNDEDAIAIWDNIGEYLKKNVVGNREKLKNRRFVFEVADYCMTNLTNRI